MSLNKCIIYILITQLSLISSQVFQIGSYILTQYALDDAPTRYATWINAALIELNSQTLPDKGDSVNPYDCWWGSYHYNIELSQAHYNFTLQDSSLSLYITSDGFHTGAIFDFNVATPVYAGGHVGAGPVCWSETDCENDIIYIYAKITINANVTIIWDSMEGKATITPDIAINVDDLSYDISHCDGFAVDLIEGWFSGDFKSYAQTKINQIIQQQLSSITQELNVPQTFSPYDGVNVTYNITDLQFEANQHAKLSAEGILKARNTNDDPDEDHTAWYIYKDESDVDASIAPPTSWPESPFYQDYNNQTTGLYLLNGLRLSSTLFSALMWAADTSGQLNPNYTFDVLDATLVFKFTWSIPLMKIPENGTLLLELTYGTVNGTCHATEGDPSEQHTIIDFQVYNLTANASIGIDSEDTLNIDIDQFYLDNVNLSLTAPPIPLPENVINALLKEMVNATVPYLNDWLLAHEFNIPDNIADYLPNPYLSIIHQNESNSTEHGYAQLLSVCACVEDDLFTACSNLQCSFPTITPSPTTDPTQSPSYSPSTEPTTTPSLSPTVHINHTFSPTVIPNSNYSIWMYLFDGPTMQQILENNVCAIETVGDEQIIVAVSNTDGICQKLTGAFQFEGWNNRNYYSLNMNLDANTIASISLLCNIDCSSCSYSSDNVEFGKCYSNITVLNDEYNVMFMEYHSKSVFNNTEMIDNQTIIIPDYNNDICIGGNARMIDNDSVIWITYQHSSNCNSQSVILQNFGAFNTCSIQSGGQYNKLTSITKSENESTVYDFATGCNASCDPSSCLQNQYSLTYNQCMLLSTNSSSKFIFSSELNVCGNQIEYNVINGTTPAPTPSSPDILSSPTGKAIIGIIITISVVMLIIIGICIWKRKQLILFCKTIFIPVINDIFKIIISSFDCSIGKISQQETIETFAMALCGALLIWQSDVWKSSSPWYIFTTEAFEKLGVDPTYLDTTKLTELLNEWTDFGSTVSVIFSTLCFLLVFARIILIKPKSTSIWTGLRIFVLSSYLIIHFFIWVGPSMKYDFKNAIHIDRSNISNTTLQASSEIIADVDEMMGYAFVGIFVSYLSNLMLFWISCVPVACYVISVIFIIRQFNDDNNNQFGFISYNIPPQPKVQLFTRLQVCLCMFQGLSSIIQALPVIILYQSFGVDVGWIILWCFWWFFPMFSLFRLTMILRKYIYQLKHPNTYYRLRESLLPSNKAEQDVNVLDNVEYTEPITLKSLRTQLWVNIIVYFLVFIITIIIAINIEKGYAENMDFDFVECNITTTFIITFIFVFCTLNEIFLLHQTSFDQRRSISDIDNITEMIDLQENQNEQQILKDGLDKNINDGDGNEVDVGNIDINNIPKHKNTAWCYQCKVCCGWLSESKERANPEIYGERVLYRRAFLLIGTVGFGYSVLHQLYSILSTTVKQEVINLLSDLNLDVTWPDNEHGGTIFDDAFELYNTARKVELAFASSSFICFTASCLFDICGRNKKGLKWSRYLSWFSILLLFISIISTALPNYLRDTDITAITPFCATSFNEAIYLISGDIVGILCSAIFTVTLLPVLISIPPSLVRATFMVLHESHIFKLNQWQKDSLLSIIIVASFLTPLITFFPLLVFQQLIGDNITAILIVFGWIAPIFVSFMFKHKKYGIKCSLYLYLIWLYIMLGSIVGIAIYEFAVYGVPQWFINSMQQIDTYTEFIAEVFLSNVVISDFLYANIMAFNSI